MVQSGASDSLPIPCPCGKITHLLPKHLAKKLFHAVRHRDYDNLTRLVNTPGKAKHDLLYAKAIAGRKSFQLCNLKSCNVGISNLLLFARNHLGENAFLVAVRMNDTTSLKILLDCAIQLEPIHKCMESVLESMVLAKDEESGWNCLHRAIYHNCLSCVKFLLEYLEQNEANYSLKYYGAKISESLIYREHFRSQSFIWRRLKKDRDHEGNTPFDLIDCYSHASLNEGVGYHERTNVMSFGSSANYLLGYPMNSDFQPFPKQIKSLSKLKIKKIVLGKYFASALSSSGEVYVWGCCHDNVIIPEKIQNSRYDTIVDISAYQEYMLLASKKGLVYVWGNCSFLCTNGKSNPSSRKVSDLLTIDSLRAYQISKAFAGNSRAIFISSTGVTLLLGKSFEGSGAVYSIPHVFDRNPIQKAIFDENSSVILNSNGIVLRFNESDERFRRYALPEIRQKFANATNIRINYVTLAGSSIITLSNTGLLFVCRDHKSPAVLVEKCKHFALKSLSCSESIACATTCSGKCIIWQARPGLSIIDSILLDDPIFISNPMKIEESFISPSGSIFLLQNFKQAFQVNPIQESLVSVCEDHTIKNIAFKTVLPVFKLSCRLEMHNMKRFSAISIIRNLSILIEYLLVKLSYYEVDELENVLKIFSQPALTTDLFTLIDSLVQKNLKSHETKPNIPSNEKDVVIASTDENQSKSNNIENTVSEVIEGKQKKGWKCENFVKGGENAFSLRSIMEEESAHFISSSPKKQTRNNSSSKIQPGQPNISTREKLTLTSVIQAQSKPALSSKKWSSPSPSSNVSLSSIMQEESQFTPKQTSQTGKSSPWKPIPQQVAHRPKFSDIQDQDEAITLVENFLLSEKQVKKSRKQRN